MPSRVSIQKEWNFYFILFSRPVFDNETEFPVIGECFKIDQYLHVKVRHNGKYVSLPRCFLHGRSAKLTRFCMLQNLSNHLANEAEKHPSSILDELWKRELLSPKNRPPDSSDVIRYALLLRNTYPAAIKSYFKFFRFPHLHCSRNYKKMDQIRWELWRYCFSKTRFLLMLLWSQMKCIYRNVQFHGGKIIHRCQWKWRHF